jgi:hypothetical protein
MSATLEAGTRLDLDAGAASASTATATEIEHMIMARAAAALASAQAYESAFKPRLAAPWIPGLFSRSPFPEHSLSSTYPGKFPAVYTARLTPTLANAAFAGWALHPLH